MNIGFDFDKVFIDYPFFIPAFIIDKVYKNKSNGELSYRIPKKAEQLIRLFTHRQIFRRPIKENMLFMEKLVKENNHKYYLISGRFGFLKKTTEKLIKKYGFEKMFKHLYFNFDNNQPHIFKNEIIQKLGIERYVDDDLNLLKFLAQENPRIKFFWLNKKTTKPLGKNLFAIKNLPEMLV